uniref:Uncharacterized protein n=1 Tax=Oryza barthii TaxID=65489 RepID=A0A0D3F0U6_9ORYZ
MPAAAAAEPFDSPRSLCGGGGIQLSTLRLSAYDVQAGDYLSYNKTGMGRLPMELLQSLELSYGMWDAANELISSKIKAER